jgi:hypothetical protein
VSYALEVYAARRPAVPDGVEVDGPFEAQDEDAPPEVAAALPAVRWLVQLTGKEISRPGRPRRGRRRP